MFKQKQDEPFLLVVFGRLDPHSRWPSGPLALWPSGPRHPWPSVGKAAISARHSSSDKTFRASTAVTPREKEKKGAPRRELLLFLFLLGCKEIKEENQKGQSLGVLPLLRVRPGESAPHGWAHARCSHPTAGGWISCMSRLESSNLFFFSLARWLVGEEKKPSMYLVSLVSDTWEWSSCSSQPFQTGEFETFHERTIGETTVGLTVNSAVSCCVCVSLQGRRGTFPPEQLKHPSKRQRLRADFSFWVSRDPKAGQTRASEPEGWAFWERQGMKTWIRSATAKGARLWCKLFPLKRVRKLTERYPAMGCTSGTSQHVS